MKRIVLLLAVLTATIASADITGPGSGTLPAQAGKSGQFLTTNGAAASWAVVSGTGTVQSVGSGTGLTGGPITTTGSLSIDQSFAPTWTNVHTYSLAEPRNIFNQTGGGTDAKNWDIDVASGIFAIRTRTDADGAGVNVIAATRGTGTALTNITIGPASGNPTYTFIGSSTTTFNGPVSSTGGGTFTTINLSGNTTVSQGISKDAGNGVNVFATSTNVATFTQTLITTKTGVMSGGTKFTAVGTGCTVGTTVGGATAGTFALATGPCTSVVLTMAGATGTTATNGWTCQAHDRTAPTVLIGGESASTTTTATITIPAGAGTADVISFSCTGY